MVPFLASQSLQLLNMTELAKLTFDSGMKRADKICTVVLINVILSIQTAGDDAVRVYEATEYSLHNRVRQKKHYV